MNYITNDPVSICRIINNLENFGEILNYLSYRVNDKPVYYSINKLMELCKRDRNQIYYLLSKIRDAGLGLQNRKISKEEDTQTAVFDEDELFYEMGAGDLVKSDSSEDNKVDRLRSVFTIINPENIVIKFPLFGEPLKDKELDPKDLGIVELTDEYLQHITKILSKSKNSEFYSILLSGYHGTNISGVLRQYEKMNLEDYKFLSTLLGISPKKISIKEFNKTDLIKATYSPHVEFSPKYDRIKFGIKANIDTKPSIISHSGVQFAN